MPASLSTQLPRSKEPLPRPRCRSALQSYFESLSYSWSPTTTGKANLYAHFAVPSNTMTANYTIQRYEVNRISSSRPTGIDKHKPYNSTLNLHETTSQDHRARTKPALAALPTPSPPSPTTSNSTLDPQITGDLYHTAAGPRASKDIEAAGSSPGARDETIGRADEATNIETTSLASCAGMDVRLVERLLG